MKSKQTQRAGIKTAQHKNKDTNQLLKRECVWYTIIRPKIYCTEVFSHKLDSSNPSNSQKVQQVQRGKSP